MGNVYKPRYCPVCHETRGGCKALYTRDAAKGFKRVGWLFSCGHVKLDKDKSQ